MFIGETNLPVSGLQLASHMTSQSQVAKVCRGGYCIEMRYEGRVAGRVWMVMDVLAAARARPPPTQGWLTGAAATDRNDKDSSESESAKVGHCARKTVASGSPRKRRYT